MDRPGIARHLRENPEVAYYIMLEGEFPMADLVGLVLSKGKIVKPDECDRTLEGVAYLVDDELVYEPRQSTNVDLATIPSPYLSGALDEFLDSPLYLPLIETNRGCPFLCTFCVWGISVLNKVRRFDLDRLAEYEYIAKRSQSSLWYFADANFGLFPRDVEIAHAIKRISDESPFLRQAVINWAKNSSKRCVEIAHILRVIAEPLVAVQSMDPEVLKNIKRDNIKMSALMDLVKQGHKDGLPMVTDVLFGLPAKH